jgi:hypothetical protein
MSKSIKQVASKSTGKSAKAAVTKALTGKARATRTVAPVKGVITLLVKANPYRANSGKAKTFAKLKPGMQVAAAIAAGVTGSDLARMAKFGRISIKG